MTPSYVSVATISGLSKAQVGAPWALKPVNFTRSTTGKGLSAGCSGFGGSSLVPLGDGERRAR